MDARSESLKKHIHAMLYAGPRRTTFYPLVAESLAQTRGESRPIRRAKAFAHLLDHVEQAVLPYERIAGSITGMWPVAEGLPSYEERVEEARQALRAYAARRDPKAASQTMRWALMARDHYNANVTYDDLQSIWKTMNQEFDEHTSYGLPQHEIFRVLEHHFNFDYGRETRQLLDELPFFTANHLHLKYETGLQKGLGGMLADVARRRAGSSDPARREFYDSVEIALQAVVRFIHRYAATLRRQAHARISSDAPRAAELLEMAAFCDHIAENKPGTFREAVQLMWMLHTVAQIGMGSAMSLGLLDRYLWPFYENDIRRGSTTRDDAKELLTHVWLKVNEPKMRTVQSVCLGGLDAAGNDITNELTFICLEVAGEVGEPYPNTHIRLHSKSSDALWERVIETLKCGCGQPSLYNDDAMIPNLIRSGIPAQDACQYYPMGCTEIMLAGMQPTYAGAGGMPFATLVEAVLNNGKVSLAEETGIDTGDLQTFRTFEDFLTAYEKQIRHRVHSQLEAKERNFSERDGDRYDPFASAFVDDCLEKGLDVCQGGARYCKVFACGSVGFGTAVDSLSAIKTFVFDRQQLTLEQLKEALDKNYEGYENIRALLASGTPAFGNDIDAVDEIARRIHSAWLDAILSYPSRIGAVYLPQMFSYNGHVYRGEATAATPNGRPRGTTISDGPGPSQGRDTRGLTCLVNSMTRLQMDKLTGGCGFNMKITPDLARGREGSQMLKALLKTFQQRGGMQVQINMVNQDTLRAAQRDPDSHRNIVVRIGGYCDYFTALDRKLQDEIIARTAQTVG